MSRNACLTVTGLLLAGLALGGASVLAADRTTPPRAEVRGELEVVTEDDFKTGQSREFHYLRSVKGERTHAIHFEGVQAPLLATGTGVVVRGSLRADGLLVVGADPADGVVAISFAETETTSDPNPLSTRSTTEDRRTLVMVLDFQDATVSCSDSEIESIMFTGAESVDDLYNESSFGALRFPPDTDGDTEPDVMRLSIDMTTSGTCDRYAWAAAADTVAENAGVDFYQYQHRVYVLPATGNTCTWAGAANVGCPSYCRTWVRYCTFPDVYAHELGHNLYMRHASTDTNDDGVADCEYCDTSDFMGYAGSSWRQVNGPHKYQKGWLPAEQIVEITTGNAQTHVLAPLETDPLSTAYPQLIRIETQTGDYYYISYRRRIGYDQNLDSDYYDRTSIHRAAADGTGSSMLVVALQDSGVFNGDDGLIVTQVGHDDSSVTLIIEGAGPLCADGDSDGLCDIDDPCPDDPQNDADSDGVCADDDCDSGNPDAFATPEEVARVVSEPIEGGQILHWNDQLAPVPDGLVYDVFSGNLSDVRSGGDFGQGTCAAEDLPTDMYEDMATTPPPGEGFYYLIRGQNECPDGTGTYGAVQRDSGAASSTASCN